MTGVLEWKNAGTKTGWVENRLRAALRRETWECWLMRIST